MKKIGCTAFLLLSIAFSVYADIVFPESLYAIDSNSGYKIMLGMLPEYIENEYGPPKNREKQFKFVSPDYEIWSMSYDNFKVWYDTYDKRIISIEISAPGFFTSKGVKVGDPALKVIESYDSPTLIYNNREGRLVYDYQQFFNEINIEGEYTSLQFTFLDDKILNIFIGIVPDV